MITDRIVGAIGEDGVAYYDEPNAVALADRPELESRTRARVHDDISGIGGVRPLGAGRRQCVLLVADAVGAAAPIRSAACAVRVAGARKVVLATPIASSAVLASLEGRIDEIACIETVTVADPVACAWRRPAVPSSRHLRRLLDEWRGAPAA